MKEIIVTGRLKCQKTASILASFIFLSGTASLASPASDAIAKLEAAHNVKELKDADRGLNELSGRSKLPEMHAYAVDPKKDGRRRAMVFRALVRAMRPEDAEKELVQRFAEDQNPEFRFQLTMEMGHLHSESLKKILRSAINNPNENGMVQLGGAWALALQHDETGKTRALESVLTADPWRDFGMQTLAVLKADDVLPKLRACRSTEQDYWRKNSCRLAELRIQLASASGTDQLQLLRAALGENGYFEVRKWSAHRLAEIGHPDAGRILASAAKERNSSAESASRGLLEGIELGHWTKEQVRQWAQE